MTEDTAIRIDHVTKEFCLAGSSGMSLKHLVVDAFKRRKKKTFAALSDVTFDVRRGETVGIVGRNGAGKSTLLSVIAGTIAPTSGHVETNGRVSSLLELGAGFHPDLTGRENIYLYGSIMNIPRAVMKKRFDSIVDFAGIGDFIDQPVRFYSSGMYVRLGFSVAVQIDPDILLVDEVLAVGDADFQKRCIQRMTSFRQAGKTLLLISHDLGTIQAISDRIAFLDHGKIIDIGNPREMIDKYRQTVFSADNSGPGVNEWGTREATLTKVEFVDAEGRPASNVGSDRIIRVAVHFNALHRIEKPVFGFNLEHREHGNIFGSNSQLEHFEIPFVEKGDGTIYFDVDASQLQRGGYWMSFSMHSYDHVINYHRLEHVLPFYIEKPPRVFDGLVALKTTYHM